MTRWRWLPHPKIRSAYRPATPIGKLSRLVDRALARAHDGMEPAPLAAARLQMELLLIHPFRDGNGRTARIAASDLLLRAGYRSTLLTVVEQHNRVDPALYSRSFAELTTSRPTQHEPWLRTALDLAASSSRWAAWFLRRRSRMREALDGIVPARRLAGSITRYDTGQRTDRRVKRALASFQPLASTWPELPSSDRRAARWQIERVISETGCGT